MSKRLVKLLTNESFIGTSALTVLGIVALVYGHIEIAGVAIGGIAAMLRGAVGQDESETLKENKDEKLNS